jgi:hypothetical protein
MSGIGTPASGIRTTAIGSSVVANNAIDFIAGTAATRAGETHDSLRWSSLEDKPVFWSAPRDVRAFDILESQAFRLATPLQC